MGVFTDKTVLILGGSRGINAAVMRRFVTDRANVRFTYTGSEDAVKRLTRETGTTAVFTDSADRDAVIDVVRKGSALDILVADANTDVFGEIPELNADDIDRLFKINIHVPYYAPVGAIRQMPEGGCTLVTSPVNDGRVSITGMAAYATSRSALQDTVRELARDFRPRGTTINIVRPGPIDTDTNPVSGPMHDMLHSLVTIKRHRQPEGVADMVAWLAGPEVSFVASTVYTIDGTFNAQPTTLSQAQLLPMISGLCLLTSLTRNGSW